MLPLLGRGKAVEGRHIVADTRAVTGVFGAVQIIGQKMREFDLVLLRGAGQRFRDPVRIGHVDHIPAQRAQNDPKTWNFARKATITTQPSDIGRNTFQPMRINWS